MLCSLNLHQIRRECSVCWTSESNLFEVLASYPKTRVAMFRSRNT